MEHKNFAIFILTHGRPDNIATIESLRKHGYTGKIYLVIDDEDKTADEYFKRYGKDVFQFNKKEYADKIDEGDNFDDRRTIVHARNAVYDIAESLNIKYFTQFDDDYSGFRYRIYEEGTPKPITNLDAILDMLLDFYINTPSHTIAISQGGDFIGGEHSRFAKNPTLFRKAMNSFICSTDRRIEFFGRMNDDVNAYTVLGNRGMLFFTIPRLSLEQKPTQMNEGGVSEMYLDYGTYVKSFYTLMYAPSCVKIALMGTSHQRLHHRISWDNAVPLIIDEKYKKG